MTKITIPYGDGQSTEYEIQTTFVLSSFRLDEIVEAEFPHLGWEHGMFVAVEETNNDTEHLFSDMKWPSRWKEPETDRILAGEKPDWLRAREVILALVAKGILPAGNWLIQVSW